MERLQLRWVALAAGGGGAGRRWRPVQPGGPGGSAAAILFDVAVGCCLVVPPVPTGAAVLRYRLYDLERIVSRTLAYGLLTLVLGGGYAAAALVLGQTLGRDSSLAVAGATLCDTVYPSEQDLGEGGRKPWGAPGGYAGSAHSSC